MDDDRPDGGDDEVDDRLDDEEEPSRPAGKLIVLPGGRKIDPRADLGAEYVASQSSGAGNTLTAEVLDPVAIDISVKEREDFVKNSRLVEAVEKGGSGAEVEAAAILEIAEELAHIKFDRRRAAKDGKNTTPFSMARVAGLKNLVDILIKRREAARGERMDLKSPRFQAVFKVWMEFFYEAMEKSGVESHVIDLVFQQMKADMIGWEKRMDGLEDS
jgi:hypothetical protein